MNVFGSIEAGGTKIVCLIAKNSTDILDQWVIQTEAPEMTLNAIVSYFRDALSQHANWNLQAVGITSFGPVDLILNSKTYGHIEQTPKPGWTGTDIYGYIKNALKVPVFLDTDVGGAALAEYTVGAGKGKESLIYITIGTGIGGAFIFKGENIYSKHHAEIGHIKVPRIVEDTFKGVCPFHGDCFEGMASGPSMEKRWGMPANQLPDDHAGWAFEAGYIGQAVINLLYTLSPEMIVLGGGVMMHDGLIDQIRDYVASNMNDYCQPDAYKQDIKSTIVLPGSGNIAGAIGGLILAENGMKLNKKKE
ncbi:MAG: ROK family protein [Anaerolineaceae bacterium]|nr:ROK family protein [Anaerolineaceae bacterium]